MKRLLIGLLVVSAFSSFAGTKRLSNKKLTKIVNNLEQRIIKIEKDLKVSCILSNTENAYDSLFVSRTAPVLEGRFFGDDERGYEQEGVTIVVATPGGVHSAIEVDGKVVSGSRDMAPKKLIQRFCELVNERI